MELVDLPNNSKFSNQEKIEFLRAYRKKFETEIEEGIQSLNLALEDECNEFLSTLIHKIITEDMKKQLYITNFDMDKDYLRLCSEVIGTICNLSSKERYKFIIKDNILDLLTFLLEISVPTDELTKYKPKISQQSMEQILQAAQAGKNFQLPVDDNFPYHKEKQYVEIWETIRRNCVILIRNLSQCPVISIHKAIASNESLVNLLTQINENINEEGFVIYYSNMSFRFLLTGKESEGERKDEDFSWRVKLCEYIINHHCFKYIIGIAVTNRLVKLPEGRTLWIHLEATRLLATITMICDPSLLSHLLVSLRMFCEAILGNSHILIHLEMSNALVKLLKECNEEDVVLTINKNEERMTRSAIALLIIGGKAMIENKERARECTLNGVFITKYLINHGKGKLLIQEKIIPFLATLVQVFDEAKEILDLLKELHVNEIDLAIEEHNNNVDNHLNNNNNNNNNKIIVNENQNNINNNNNNNNNNNDNGNVGYWARIVRLTRSYCNIL